MHLNDTTNDSSPHLCECGCGQPAPIAKYSDNQYGWIKGQPKRFIKGHNRRRPPTSQKACTACGETKPVTDEFFPPDKRASDGFASQCRTCERARSRKRRKAYYAANQEQERRKSRQWYAAHKEEAAAYARVNHAENAEHIADKRREYRVRNRERIRKYNRAWRAKNRDRMRLHKRHRRALKLAAEGSHTTADVERQYKAQKGKCYYCDIKVGDAYQVDHVIPLSRGGSDGPENIVIACRRCNIAKKDRLPHEWPQGNRLL